ncbi:hypothetical protein FH972_000998 [Carpinus fangiana]|uniref:Uncharacterized protein n=1 Tax=Carpinus fangiana TaxID=176857 RepID=A0A5N6QD29_9ROSI|nr:hypothetical protein FH972_000998 [Carpinus fangiana]
MPGYQPHLQIEYTRSFRWVLLSSFCNVLNGLCVVDFDYSSNLSKALKKLMDDLTTREPFSRSKRFSDNVMYVCVDKPQLFAQVAEVMRVLATPQTMLTAAVIKDYFSAIARMRKVIHSQEDGDRVVFSRETFEREFELYWED